MSPEVNNDMLFLGNTAIDRILSMGERSMLSRHLVKRLPLGAALSCQAAHALSPSDDFRPFARRRRQKIDGSRVFSPTPERRAVFAVKLGANWKFRSTLPKALKKRWKVPMC